MSIEVACPACGGSIQIEEAGEVVACPLCQVHLQIDPETSEPLLVSAEPDDDESETTAEATESETATAETGEETKAASPFDFLPGGHQAPKTETRETPKFDFLPGGASESAAHESAEVTEPEATDEQAEEATSETAEATTEEATAAAADTEEASPFAFLAGGNQPPKTEARDTPKFDFLPGGANETADSDSAEVTEPEPADEQAEETPTETANTTTEEAAAESAEADTEEASTFAFLAGGNEPPKTEARDTPKFDFLPGGTNETADSDSAEVTEPEPADEQAEETPAETAEATTEEAAAEVAETDTEETPAESATASPFSFLPGGDAGEPASEETERPATNFSFLPGGGDEANTDESEATEEAVAEANSTTAVETTTAETSETEATEEAAPPEETSGDATTPAETLAAGTESTETEAVESETAESAPATQETAAPAPQSYRKEKVVPKKLFTLTLTYAIAATIMVAMLLYAKYQGDPHQLESLPDLKPPIKNDEIALQLVPENAELPPGHTLQLGGPGRRFGNVMVTPLRVTRGPLEFEHYTGDASKTREHTAGDVLKLYLKFENMSDDQTFEPLDQKLLLSRVPGKTPESPMRANNFVCRLDQQKPDGERVLVYDMPPSWDWNLKGQNINRETTPQKLAPGESFETYVATNEQGIDSLTGELVWRVQIRKGYNPQSHRGVTTLIDVVFNSDQIQKDVPAESKAALPTS
ncbi:hypothetical protein Pan153_58350 [Gimesia panareensis]|uniref:Uncharacterized protein n=1 Tax=Gimesia panareensis TaxID=2527978 RepID=A0A518FXQ8_9PLAN|nr:hypothetical protein [Gimesia panareensis]QDV21153.1 hypothetical protein Pan153_58350 [Gimesia panareensis]